MSRELGPMSGLVPKKRTAAEDNDDDDNDDEQMNQNSDAIFQQEDNAKRARLASLSDTTLQDLPNELLECILVKVVAMEVKDLKLIKSVWKDKADLVISRLKSVSPHWTSILSTNSFRCKLHRTLDDTAEVTIRLEMLHQSATRTQPFDFDFVASLKDDIFTVEQPDGKVHAINVYHRDNMAVVKDVIPLEAAPECMTACNVSNCIYVGLPNGDNTLSVKRIANDGDNQFNISPWTLADPKLSIYRIFVPGNGNLLIRPLQTEKVRNVVLICDANGSLLREVMLPRGIPGLRQETDCVQTVLQKSNGTLNLVVVYKSECKTKLLEIDANGSVVRRYTSQIEDSLVNFADINGRIVIADSDWESGSMELLDSEFNLVGIYDFEPDDDDSPFVCDVSFMSERNEILRTRFDCISETHEMSIYRFTEE